MTSVDKVNVRGVGWHNHLVQVTHLLNVSYGYTLSIWSAGAVAIGHYGPPTIGYIMAFVIGVLVAYLMLALTVRSHHYQPVPQLPTAFVVTNWIPIVSAIFASALCTLLPWAIPGYFLAGLVATLSYALALTLLLAVRERYAPGESGKPVIS
jgi:hypothetical protein